MPDTNFESATSSPVDVHPHGAHQARESRKKTYLSGLLVYGTGAFTSDCVVRNISAGGAGITTAKHQPLPADFYLIVVKYGLACHAQVAWLSFHARGLRFTDKHFLKESTPLELNYLRRLWLEHCPRCAGVPVVEPWETGRSAAPIGPPF